MKFSRGFVFVLLCAVLVTGTLFAGGQQGGKETGDIQVGCLQDITGPTSSLGQMVDEGAKWAIAEINAAGGVNGRKINVTTYDTRGDVNEAINAFTRMVTSGNVSAIIGPPVANIAMAIAPISERYNVPILGFAIDTKCQIKEDGTPYKNMFLFQPNADQQAEIMASYAIKNGFKRFGILYNQANAYSVSLLPAFVNRIQAEGQVVVEPIAYNPQDRDFKTLLGKITSQNVDAIYAPVYVQELILIVQQARAIGFRGALINGLDACPPFNTLLGEPCDNIYFINNVDDTESKLQDMIGKVKAEKGIDATNKFFLGYDVGKILAKIFGDVGTDPAKVAEAVANISNFSGLTGNISIDPATHMPRGLEMVMFNYNNITPVFLERYAAK
ncbi:MAG: ABC transporter substrate-binding protein [Treponema sp.]|jgi:branched-chain amino acid transport system substrate-binding protein|nr:ABC transporter substrate-binding protein [Treponema sp.]